MADLTTDREYFLAGLAYALDRDADLSTTIAIEEFYGVTFP